MFLTENKGQWNDAVQFRAEIPAGRFYMDTDGFTFQLYDADALAQMHTGNRELQFSDIGIHVVKTRFAGANAPSEFEHSEPSVHYYNFFLGNDSSRWAGNVKSYGWVKRKELYEGIDLRVYRHNEELKYDLIVQPGADAAQVELEYEGADSLVLRDGQLHVYTPVRHYVEQPPFAYQMRHGRLIKVACHYELDGQTLRFLLPSGYDESLELVIDPEISFSSYVGSTQSSFGYTATYDDDGHLYAGAIAFGAGYPTTAGVFDAGHNGGTIDIGITKFSPDGTQLIYSTFIGGSGNESPHSLVVNDNNELYVLGSTGSSNFPTTAGVVQPSFQAGNSLTFDIGYGFSHSSGTDIFVTKFNAAGSTLAASTFIGGSGNDGINSDPAIEYNYGDAFRGEIIVDENSNVFVASVTSSLDFPTSPGAFQTGYGGGSTDGCVFKLNPNLSTILWASYLGGSGGDAGFSVQLNDAGAVYVAGATRSSNLNTSNSAFNPDFQGNTDGFVAAISATGQNLLGLTYLGTPEFDEAFFVQLDTDGNVYVVGQTEGDYPVSPGVYSNPNSGQFLQKLNPGLNSSLLSTVVGNGNGGPNISISAFLVSNCDQIYISGWGGQTNASAADVWTSTTFDLPVTADAFQSTTDGDDFYLMVLSPEAENLVYATYFGGGSSNEHVDGGTSRFDKRGTVYQAVCAGCGGNDDFPTQPGVWSETNPSSLAHGQCNLGVFKFDLANIHAQIEIDGPDEVCVGSTVNFINNTTTANQFFWDFGGQGTSTATNPGFEFDEPGDYTITMVASHDDECIMPDSTSIEITVLPLPEINISTATSICAGDSTELFVDGGTNYLWSPADQVDDPTSPNPTVWCDETTTFYVTLDAACGSLTDTVTVMVFDEEYGAGEDQQVCPGESVGISASGGGTYSWTPGETLNNVTSANPQASPDETTVYHVEITSPNGCLYHESVQVSILPGPPVVQTAEVAAICEGGSVGIWASGGDEYQWEPTPGLNHYDIHNPLASPGQNTWYIVHVSNQCGTTIDSVLVNVGEVNPFIQQPDTACPGQPIVLHASGGAYYNWQPQTHMINENTANPTVSPMYTTTYTVTVTDQYGCADMASVVAIVYDPPYVFTTGNEVVDYFTFVDIGASSNGTLSWESDLPVSCTTCPITSVQGTDSDVVYVTATDENGCTATDSLLIEVTGALYVPNAFTPNGDGINDLFKAVGAEIEDFHLQIFDRWGELIFESFDIDVGWDGGVGDHYVESEVYVWDIVAKEHTGVHFEMRGHVTVIR